MKDSYRSASRQTLGAFFLIAIVVLLFSLYSSALSESYCGDNVTWALSDTGVLTISGTGYPFSYKSQGAPWYDQRNNIYSVVVGDGVNSLESYLFEDCENLTSISLGNDVYGFSTNCITNCPKLTELTIPNGVSMWGTPIITQCPNLTVYCKKSAHSIFGSLRAGNIEFVVTDSDSDFIIENNQLIGYAGNETKVIIPSGVTEIGYQACSYLQNTEEIVLPSSVTRFSNMAFEHCVKLKTIEIPTSITEFGPAVFEGCTSLETINIPNSIRSIPSSTFDGCTSLKTIHIPASVTTIQWFAFSGCSNLETVYYSGTEAYRSRMSIGDYNECLTNAEWIYGDEEPPEGIHYCGDNVTWTLSEAGVLTISGTGYPFSYHSHGAPWYDQRNGIYSVVVEDGVNSLESYFFEDCVNLTSVILGSSVYGFSSNCIVNCPNLTELTIPNGVSMWGTPIISQCPNLTVYCKKAAHSIFGSLRAGNIAFIVTDSDSDFVVEGNTLIGYTGNATKLIIPSGIEEIGYEACSYLLNTEEVVLPDSIKRFSNMAFEHCEKLKKITIPNSVNEFGPAVFQGCTSLETIAIPSSINSIPSSTFEGCTNLKNIYLPASVTSIQWFAFSGCSALQTVYYSETESYKSRMSIGDYNEPLVNALWVYKVELSKSIKIPASTIEIAEEAFYGNSAAVVFINSSCTTIGHRSFGNCKSLVEIHVPESVVHIADDFLDGSPNAVIYCAEGSKIAEWAEEHSRNMIIVP